MRVSILLALLLVSGTAAATPAPQCSVGGDIVLELQLDDTAPDAENLTVTLWGNATVTVVWRHEKHETLAGLECLPPAQFKAITADLKASPWKVTPAKTAKTCKDTSTKSMIVRVAGKPVFTERPCNPDVLDARSAATVKRLKTRLPMKATKDCTRFSMGKGCPKP